MEKGFNLISKDFTQATTISELEKIKLRLNDEWEYAVEIKQIINDCINSIRDIEKEKTVKDELLVIRYLLNETINKL